MSPVFKWPLGLVVLALAASVCSWLVTGRFIHEHWNAPYMTIPEAQRELAAKAEDKIAREIGRVKTFRSYGSSNTLIADTKNRARQLSGAQDSLSQLPGRANAVRTTESTGCQWVHPHWEHDTLTLTVPENCGGGWSLVTQSSANAGLTLTLGPWTKGALMGAPEIQDQYSSPIVLAFNGENWTATIPPRTEVFIRPIEGASIKIVKEEK